MKELEEGGGDVAEGASGFEDGVVGGVGVGADEDEGDRVGCVGGVRATGEGVDEHLGVAVIGGDEEVASALLDGLIDAVELGVDGLNGLDGGLELAGVTDHVGVGEVDDDDIEGGVVDGLDDGVGDAGRGHLGREVVGSDLLGRNEDAVFAGERLFDASVEEVGNVRVLLGLGDAEVAQTSVGHDVGEEVFHRLGWDDDGKVEVFVVLRHADVVDVFGRLIARNLVLQFGCFGQFVSVVGGDAAGDVAVAGEDAGDLTDPVGAEVEADADVVVADGADGMAVGVDYGEGWDELVGDAVVVELADAGEGVDVGSPLRVAGDRGVEGLTLLFPAEVAVHGVVAAGD